MFENGSINFETSLRGMGTNITVLSVLANSAIPVNVTTEYHGYRWFSTMKSIFNVSKLTVIEKEELENDQIRSIGDLSKLFSPYLSVDRINLYNRSFEVGRDKKPCIGFACYNDADEVFDSSNFKIGTYRYPKNRWYPIEYWKEVFQYVKQLGYDVITFDSRKIDVENKIFMLNEMCDAVIGYEGGVAHLAHLLKVPVIMLPWHNSDVSFLCHFLHLDTKTYFLDSHEELLSWTPQQFKNVIEDLKNDKGNNVVFQETRIDVTRNLQDFKMVTAFHGSKLSEFERELILKTHREIKFGGHVPINFIDNVN